MEKKNSVGIVVTNDIINDSRVKKIASSLSTEYSVIAIGVMKKDTRDLESGSYVSKRIRLTKKNKFAKYLQFVIGAIRSLKHVDIVHCNDIDTLPIGILLKMLYSTKVVYDAHELESGKNGMSPFKSKVNWVVEFIFIRFVDLFVTVNASIMNYYCKNFSINESIIVSNYPKFKLVRPTNSDGGSLKFLYLGGFSVGRGLESLIEVFKNISSYKLDIVGYGPLKSTLTQSVEGVKNIRVLDPVPMETIAQFANSYDMGFCIIENTCLSYQYAAPNKFFEYVMASLPVICNDLVEVAPIVRKNQIGLIVDNSVVSIIENLLKLDFAAINEMKDRLDDTLKKEFSWETQEVILLTGYRKLLNA